MAPAATPRRPSSPAPPSPTSGSSSAHSTRSRPAPGKPASRRPPRSWWATWSASPQPSRRPRRPVPPPARSRPSTTPLRSSCDAAQKGQKGYPTMTPSAPIPDVVAAELAQYEEHIKQYRRGELGEVKMQKLRLQFGTYAQRQEGVQMQRIKIPGGTATADQLIRLADAADRFGSGFVHFTTREDAQIYYVKLDEVPALLR